MALDPTDQIVVSACSEMVTSLGLLPELRIEKIEDGHPVVGA